jgi:hypothetical protein
MLISTITTPERTAILIYQGQIQFSEVIRIHQVVEETTLHMHLADLVLPTAIPEVIQFLREAQVADHIHQDLLTGQEAAPPIAAGLPQDQAVPIHQVHPVHQVHLPIHHQAPLHLAEDSL